MEFFGMPNWFWTLMCFGLAAWFALRVPPHITHPRDKYGFSLLLLVLGGAFLLAPLAPDVVPSLALLALLLASLVFRGAK